MITVLRNTYPIAKKQYNCQAYEWISNVCDSFEDMTFSERKHIVIARKNKGNILKGQRYLYQVQVDSKIITFRAIPELHEICLKYNIYPEY